MKPAGLAARSGPALLPLGMLLVPKCPLCLLALLAAFGVGLPLPSGPVLDGFVLAAALGWLAILFVRDGSPVSRAAGLAGAALLLGGRAAGLPAASFAGALVMVAVVLRARLWPELSGAVASPPVHCAGSAAAPRD